MSATSPSQAWAILMRHARDEIGPLRLKELCTDNDRVSSLVAAHTFSESAASRITSANDRSPGFKMSSMHNSNRMMIADLSRQRMTLETVNHLLRLAQSVDIKGFILTLAWGQNNRFEPVKPASINGNTVSKQQQVLMANNQLEISGINAGFNRGDTNNNNNHFLKKTRFADNFNSEINSTVRHTTTGSNHSSIPTNKIASQTPQTSPSMHMALRTPSDGTCMFTSNGANALEDVHSQWRRIKLLTSSIRKGQNRGVSGQNLQNILVVGRGVAFSAIQFVYEAIRRDKDASVALSQGLSDFPSLGSVVGSTRRPTQERSMRFLSTFDPISISSVLSDINPEQTIVVAIAIGGDEADIIYLVQNTIKQWLRHGLKSHVKNQANIWSKHIVLITGNESLFHSQQITNYDRTFLIPSFARSEAFTSFTAACLLPLSLAFGWELVQEMKNGAHDLDSHFVETNPRHNLPVLLALVDIWNDHFLPSSQTLKSCGGRIITPFMENLSEYASFVAAIESQVYGRASVARTRASSSRVAPSAMVIDGGLRGKYDRVLYQGGRAPPSELIISMETQAFNQNDNYELEKLFIGSHDSLTNQDLLISSFFAHADTMAFGSNGMRLRETVTSPQNSTKSPPFGAGLASSSFDSYAPSVAPPISSSAVIDSNLAQGNRPSTLLICSRCDAFTCGQLIALAEHRSLITARLWDVDNPLAFVQSHGSTLRTREEDTIKEKFVNIYQHLQSEANEEDEDMMDVGPKLNLATTTLLSHFARTMLDLKNSRGYDK